MRMRRLSKITLMFAVAGAVLPSTQAFQFETATTSFIGSTRGRHFSRSLNLFALSDPYNSNSNDSRRSNDPSTALNVSKNVVPLLRFTLHSFLVALLLVGWEDLTCLSTLPSRHRTSYLAEASQRNELSWGESTVRGMGFGRDERLMLSSSAISTSESRNSGNPSQETTEESQFDLSNRPSYNEVMLFHRTFRVPQWKRDLSASTTTQQDGHYYSNAIHTLCQCLASFDTLKDQVNNYQWDTLRRTLHSQPWSELEWAASRLRPVDEAVGFDWGSCAWRGRCNAWADAQEALDEVDFLAGVLEPYEAIFCLDIVERSIRDMLVLAPWDQALPQDVAYWKQVSGTYQPHRVFDPELEDEESERIDDEYVQALQSLRID